MVHFLFTGLVELGGLAREVQASAFGRGGTGGRRESWSVLLLHFPDFGKILCAGHNYGGGRPRRAKLAEGRGG